MSPVLTVRHEYKLMGDRIREWVRIRFYCGSQACPNGEFAKEPKFSVQTVGRPQGPGGPAGPYNLIQAYDDGGAQIASYRGLFPCHPTQCTGHTLDIYRFRVRLADESNAFPAINVIAMSANPGGQTLYRWAGEDNLQPWFGIDGWAYWADRLLAANTSDGPVGGHGNCGNGHPTDIYNKDWEFVGYRGDPGDPNYGPYPFSVYFHGWTGGTGPPDCEPLARLLLAGNANTWRLANYFRFDIGTAPTDEPVPPRPRGS
jgi:hypothetical protein